MMKSRKEPINIFGARSNNLKGFDCSIPRNALTVVTGVSGSGKSTLAFETLFAEGQRRYVESLSAYARQFLQKMARPDVEKIENIPPAIAIEQRNRVRNARSTVGTATEIHDYLRLLFAKVGERFCSTCHVPVRQDTPESIFQMILRDFTGARAVLLVEISSINKAISRDRFLKDGFRRVLVKIALNRYELLDLEDEAVLDIPWIGIVLDRVIVHAENRKRILENLELGFVKGKGKVTLYLPEQAQKEQQFFRFHSQLQCNQCEKIYEPASPVQFSFNNPLGACQDCQGFGRIVGMDLDRVIPDPNLTLREGAIDPFTKPAYESSQADLQAACVRERIPMNRPWKTLTPAEQGIILQGKGKWYGVKGFFDWLEKKRYKVHVRIFLARFRGYTPCLLCKGERLRQESLHVRIRGKNIAQVCALPVADLRKWFESIEWTEDQRKIAKSVLKEVSGRLQYLNDVGLGYLTLSRQARTLSGGESQRIALASALGSSLTDTLYVLDEPSIGLHPRDSTRLLKVLFQLRNLGNTLVIVEHDPQIIRHADRILDLGPHAGRHGGELVFQGSYEELLQNQKSLTGQYLHSRNGLEKGPLRRAGHSWLEIVGASVHNLRSLDANLPLGVMTAITGVSGAGKSSLIQNVLFAGFERERGITPRFEMGHFREIRGLEHVHEMILMDQEPLGKSLRSNTATYMGFFSEIRRLFSLTSQAKRRGLAPGAFSFNVPGGRCETCQGAGYLTVEMQFLEDVTVPCEACGGKRFLSKVLAVSYKNLNIFEVLNLTVSEAEQVFIENREIVEKLRVLKQVGLDYLTLGQASSTLSGGEVQRLKLAAHIARGERKGVVYLFDEPTTGLHLYDIEKLIQTLQHLVSLGNSVMVIEHNLNFIYQCDYVLDLGPEGGESGGKIVAQGTPEVMMKCFDSHTGNYLREYIAGSEKSSQKSYDS